MFKKHWVILAILLFGFLLRVYQITELPLYGDELTLAYDAYSISKTGMDQTGETLPLTFRMGAGRPGGYIYASLPFIALFGPSALGIRSLSLLSGIGIIFLVYLLAKKVFNQKVALLSAFVASISPWDIYLSRAGFEAHFALFLVLLGIVAFLYAGRKNILFIVWAVAWGLAIHTYPTYKLTLPFIFLSLLWYTRSNKLFAAKKLFFIALTILALFTALSARENLVGRSEERFGSINIFANKDFNEQIIQRINYERSVSTAPAFLKPFLYNKQIEYGRTLLELYVHSIGSDVLFLRGDRNPRHNPAEFGMLYLIELPLLLIALYFFREKNKKELILLGSWILIAPLGSVFLGDPTHSLRNSLMLPAFILISAFALSKLPKNIFKVFISLFAVQGLFILSAVYFLAPNKFAGFWASQAKAATKAANEQKANYDNVYISESIDNIEYAYPLYTKVDPSVVIGQQGKFPKKFGNVQLVNVETLSAGPGKSLVIIPKNVSADNLIPGISTFELVK